MAILCLFGPNGNYIGVLRYFDSHIAKLGMGNRFRGFLPVVVDVEMGGVDPATHALLEIGVVFVEFTNNHRLESSEQLHYHVTPAAGTRLDKASLEFNQIDPYHPLRLAVEEADALQELFQRVAEKNAENGCKRAIVVGHNAWFDLMALMSAARRSKIKQVPFHSFSSIDTASLGAVLNGQTVLARICQDWGIDHDPKQAHSALYDAQITAQLFCAMVNTYHNAINP